MGSLRDLEHNVGEELDRKNDEEIIMKKKKNAQLFRILLVNIQEVILGTKLCLLLPAIPLAILAQYYHFARVSNLIYLLYSFCFNLCDIFQFFSIFNVGKV